MENQSKFHGSSHHQPIYIYIYMFTPAMGFFWCPFATAFGHSTVMATWRRDVATGHSTAAVWGAIGLLSQLGQPPLSWSVTVWDGSPVVVQPGGPMVVGDL